MTDDGEMRDERVQRVMVTLTAWCLALEKRAPDFSGLRDELDICRDALWSIARTLEDFDRLHDPLNRP